MTPPHHKPPLVSVVLPAHNAETTIVTAVESVLQSTFTNLELLVIDDGSTDETRIRVGAISDARLQLVQRQHKGLCDSLNFGVRHARAPYIARMDADDSSTPERLAKQLAFLQDNQVDAVGGQIRIVDGSGGPVGSMSRYEKWINSFTDTKSIATYRFIESPVVHPTVLARREIFELGYREGHWPEDYDLWLRAIQKGYKFATLPEVVLTWADSEGRLTRTHERYSPEAFDRCRRMHLLEGPLKGITDILVWGAGQTGKPWIRWLVGRGIQVNSIIEVAPRKIGVRIHGTTVVPPDELPTANGTMLLIAVGADGARDLILDFIRKKGYVAGTDAWFVA